MGVTQVKKDIYVKLDELNIKYKTLKHKEVFTFNISGDDFNKFLEQISKNVIKVNI